MSSAAIRKDVRPKGENRMSVVTSHGIHLIMNDLRTLEGADPSETLDAAALQDIDPRIRSYIANLREEPGGAPNATVGDVIDYLQKLVDVAQGNRELSQTEYNAAFSKTALAGLSTSVMDSAFQSGSAAVELVARKGSRPELFNRAGERLREKADLNAVAFRWKEAGAYYLRAAALHKQALSGPEDVSGREVKNAADAAALEAYMAFAPIAKAANQHRLHALWKADRAFRHAEMPNEIAQAKALLDRDYPGYRPKRIWETMSRFAESTNPVEMEWFKEAQTLLWKDYPGYVPPDA